MGLHAEETRMIEEQPIIGVKTDTLLEKVEELHQQGYRLVQIGATTLPDCVEVNYSFDLASKFVNLRLALPHREMRIPSISKIYWCAFIYENEMHDLFRIEVDGMAVDFKGQFYRTTVPAPWAPVAPAAAASQGDAPVSTPSTPAS